jgi:uncharacterized protein with HEPN domain/predicted nucleotidyltransferase
MSLLDLIDAKRPEILRIAAKHGARDLRLFGSVARLNDREASDVDLLADVSDFREQLALMEDLRQLLGVQVDVVADAASEFRSRVLPDAIPLDAPDFREQAVLQSQRPYDQLERDHERLRLMLDHCDEILQVVSGLSRERYMADPLPRYALLKLLELVGEYAARISPEFKAEHGDIPWTQMAGFRNRAVHDYGRLDFGKIWDEIIDIDVPKLKVQLEGLL